MKTSSADTNVGDDERAASVKEVQIVTCDIKLLMKSTLLKEITKIPNRWFAHGCLLYLNGYI